MLAIVTTHPIQYQVPLWQMLARNGKVPFEVWYLTAHAVRPSHDPGFGADFAWDMDLLAGYPYRFLEVAEGAAPGSFWKCRLKERLRDRLRASNVRAIWINGWQVAAYWQAVWDAKAAGTEVWLRGESNDLAPVPWWKWAAKKVILGRLFQRVDRFLYIGSANRRLYQKLGVPDKKLFPAPYAVDNERFAKQANKLRGTRKELREEWGIPEDAFVVLFCGKFIRKKHPHHLIEAAERLLKTHPNLKIHLLFAGSGELGGALRAACHVVFDAEQPQTTDNGPQTTGPDNQEPITNNAKPRASFTGFLNQTEVSRAYVAADVLVLPSDYGETWGLVVNEAIASGLPCIVSNRCGCAEDIAAMPGNSIYDCGNIDDLANKLLNLSHSQGDLARFNLPFNPLNKTILTVNRIWNELTQTR